MRLFDEHITKYLKNSIKVTLGFSRWILLILLIVFLFSGIYSVSQNEIAVLQRFGKIKNDRVGPGIHYALPWPIDKVSKVPVKIVKGVQINDFYQSNDPSLSSSQFFRKTGLETYCISGDNNIVVINCVIQYTILKPTDYLFSLKQPEEVLYDVTCNNILKCLSKISVDEILTYGKQTMKEYIQTNMQVDLDNLNSGLRVSFVELKDVRPPEKVQQFFNDVINAQIDKRKMVSNAESYFNEKIPEAKGKANRLLQEAESYENEVISKAEGETKRFLSKLEEYEGRESITQKRLYLEFAKNMFSNLEEKYIIDQNGDQELIKLQIKVK